MGGKPWTAEEESYLKENWGVKSIPAIAQNLGKTENAVVVRKNRLGLGAFLDNGEYITFNQLLVALGYGKGDTYKATSWIRNRNCPVKNKKVGACSFRVVYLDAFWKWAEKYRSFIDWSRLEENTLGMEPDWVKPLRKAQYQKSRYVKATPWTKEEDALLKQLVDAYTYSWPEIAARMQRTEGAVQRRLSDLGVKSRPLKADNHSSWTDEHFGILTECIKARLPYMMMTDRIGKSEKSIRGKVYSMYLTENVDKAAAIMGNGKFGDNRPARKITDSTLNSAERMEVKDSMTAFVRLLKSEICKHYEDNDYWQRELCRHWNNGCEAGETNCDDCQSFERIRPQYCKRCGITFTERHENLYCPKCRAQRKKAAQRKYAIVNGMRVYNFAE